MKKNVFVGILIIIFCLCIDMIYVHKINKKNENYENINEKIKEDINSFESLNKDNIVVQVDTPISNKKIIDDWRLTLVNYENMLPDDYEMQLANIDSIRQFDSRAIDELNQMLKDMKKSGITDVWVQSSYRSIECQTSLFNEKINTYMLQGKTREEAESLTLQTINRPGTSEHNLGLAVDLNYVDYSFDRTKGFIWLQENAENYGFILRYKKEKEDITKVDYEPWHWRYVGVENAKKMNELNMCLEEYIDYLKKYIKFDK